MAGINGSEFLIIVIIALVVIGPERLPKYAEQLAHLVKGARKFLAEAKSRVDDELGPEMKDIDWQKLDPRQYDPRRIVKEALIDDTILDPQFEAKKAARTGAALGAAGAASGVNAVGGPAFAATANGALTDSTGVAPGIANAGALSGTLGFDSYTPLAPNQAAPFDSEAT